MTTWRHTINTNRKQKIFVFVLWHVSRQPSCSHSFFMDFFCFRVYPTLHTRFYFALIIYRSRPLPRLLVERLPTSHGDFRAWGVPGPGVYVCMDVGVTRTNRLVEIMLACVTCSLLCDCEYCCLLYCYYYRLATAMRYCCCRTQRQRTAARRSCIAYRTPSGLRSLADARASLCSLRDRPAAKNDMMCAWYHTTRSI